VLVAVTVPAVELPEVVVFAAAARIASEAFLLSRNRFSKDVVEALSPIVISMVAVARLFHFAQHAIVSGTAVTAAPE
jgi:hypothetical protein